MDRASRHTTRRVFLKTSAGLAAAAAFTGETRGERRTFDSNRRMLLKGGTIVSMDPSVGDFVKGDVLIQGKKIAAVGANLQSSGEVIDASNTIVIRGKACSAGSFRMAISASIWRRRTRGSRSIIDLTTCMWATS